MDCLRRDLRLALLYLYESGSKAFSGLVPCVITTLSGLKREMKETTRGRFDQSPDFHYSDWR